MLSTSDVIDAIYSTQALQAAALHPVAPIVFDTIFSSEAIHVVPLVSCSDCVFTYVHK